MCGFYRNNNNNKMQKKKSIDLYWILKRAPRSVRGKKSSGKTGMMELKNTKQT
jgi:hypothetical protein